MADLKLMLTCNMLHQVAKMFAMYTNYSGSLFGMVYGTNGYTTVLMLNIKQMKSTTTKNKNNKHLILITLTDILR